METELINLATKQIVEPRLGDAEAFGPNVARRLGVRRFDAAEYLRDEADIAAYLEAAAAEEDPGVLAAALGDVARAREGVRATR